MILSRGQATTDEEIIAEYHQYLDEKKTIKSVQRLHFARLIPITLCKHIGKPILQWNEDDLLSFYRSFSDSTIRLANSLLAFLFLRGYYRPSIHLLFSLPFHLAHHFPSAVLPYRQRFQEAQRELRYQVSGDPSNRDNLGSVVELYLWLLVFSQKQPEELTREDFDLFRQEYQARYRQQRKGGLPDPRLHRLELLLVHLGIIPAKKRILAYEPYFADLPQTPIREAIYQFFDWCNVKYKNKLKSGHRRALHFFFTWLSDRYPACQRLDAVTCPLALEYVQHLIKLCEENGWSLSYLHDLHQSVRTFFEFVIREELEAAPGRNPFTKGDLPAKPDMVPRYIPDPELRTVLDYCKTDATELERTVVIILLHTGIRAAELAALRASDVIQIGGRWKLHIHEGKGLKDRVIPLTDACLKALQDWMTSKNKQESQFLFGYHGRRWNSGKVVGTLMREVSKKAGVKGITPHRFRHTFAVALLNYGVREFALQKLMGHAKLDMTLEYARILDETVERSFSEAIEQMQEGSLSWVPNFFAQEDYTLFAEGDSVSWIQLPVGYCRRNPKLHCESDVKCFLCERFCATPKDLPRLQQMYERFTKLGLKLKADVISAQIQQLRALPQNSVPVLIPTNAISVAPKRAREH